jgi:hypothetical protein
VDGTDHLGDGAVTDLHSDPPDRERGVAVALLVLLAFLATRTRWAPAGPDDPHAPRPWGCLVTAAARTYAANVRLFLGIGAIFIVIGGIVTALQYLVFRHGGLSPLVDAFGTSNGLTETVVIAFGFVVNLLGLAIVQAACASALAESIGTGARRPPRPIGPRRAGCYRCWAGSCSTRSPSP